MKRNLPAYPIYLLSLFAILASGLLRPAHAQTMYRCGSVFQDRPCESGQQKVIGTIKTPGSSDKPVLDLSCTRRGEEAKKIIWMREGGALQDKLLAEASSSERRKLIADVYAIRGNSSDVRAAIENDCMAEKANAQQFGNRIDEDLPSQARTAAQRANTNAAQEKQTNNAADTTNTAALKRAQCDTLKNQLANTRSAQRWGGSAGTMDSLNQQRRSIESQLKSLGCDSTQGLVQ
ncbi:hypothetical protein LPB67_08265 [Undibacterium sp. Jales W-56]|uniref:hypothetical protein n=1 Tax=Undibacterium sp. Jales W-56 TaxID=2897325 RepID=UPI0021D3ABA0|nr:hypothetical protein [Undibacterium sp. Jales W-56]MCU6433771.1 hypothetical protein [Undibacterium sp. Jales W-56]